MPSGINTYNFNKRVDKLKKLIANSERWMRDEEYRIMCWRAEIYYIEIGALTTAQHLHKHPEDLSSLVSTDSLLDKMWRTSHPNFLDNLTDSGSPNSTPDELT